MVLRFHLKARFNSEKQFLRNLFALSPTGEPTVLVRAPFRGGICAASDNIYYVAEGFDP